MPFGTQSHPQAGRNKGVYIAKGWLLRLGIFLVCFSSLSPLEQHLQPQEAVFPKSGRGWVLGDACKGGDLRNPLHSPRSK